MAKILCVLTGASYWTLKDGHRHPAGYWDEEFVAPYSVFTDAGHIGHEGNRGNSSWGRPSCGHDEPGAPHGGRRGERPPGGGRHRVGG